MPVKKTGNIPKRPLQPLPTIRQHTGIISNDWEEEWAGIGPARSDFSLVDESHADLGLILIEVFIIIVGKTLQIPITEIEDQMIT